MGETKLSNQQNRRLLERRYDGNGNVTQIGGATSWATTMPTSNPTMHSLLYTNGTNKLSSTPSPYGGSYTYDANGNVKYHEGEADVVIYQYDVWLNKVKSRDEGTNEGFIKTFYAYNSSNERMWKQVQQRDAFLHTTKTVYFHGDNPWPLVERQTYQKQNVAGTVTYQTQSSVKWHIYGKNGIIATHTNAESIEFPLKDHLGSPRVVLKQTITQGGVSDLSENSRYAWHPFGGMLESYGDAEPDYGFTGQEKDHESGLHNFRARAYHEQLGRFFAVDPQGQYHSPYVYGGNNPFMYTDPDGEFAFLIPLAIGAAIGGAGYTASVAFSKGGLDNWDWGALGKSMAIGAVSGVASAGIGSAFGAVGSNGLMGELGRAYMHGFASGTISHFTGGDFMTGFAAGGLGSLAGSAFSSYGGSIAKNTWGQVGFSSLMGGLGAELTGGDFWQGAATGATVGLLNHAMHDYMNDQQLKKDTELGFGNEKYLKRYLANTNTVTVDQLNTMGQFTLGMSTVGVSNYIQNPLLNLRQYYQLRPLEKTLLKISRFNTRWIGPAGNFIGAYNLYNDYTNPAVSTERFVYRSTGFVSAIGAGYVVTALASTPWGFVASAGLGLTFAGAEAMYDISTMLYQRTSFEINQIEQAYRRFPHGY